MEASRARRVLVTHGFSDVLARVLRERGLKASVLPTRFVGETSPDTATTDEEPDDDEDAPQDRPREAGDVAGAAPETPSP